MKNHGMDIRAYSRMARKRLGKYFEMEIQDIIEADRNQNFVPSELMGGIDGISAYCLVSQDLINAAHYDLDTLVGISIFTEKIAGRADGWYFVLPNTIIKGGDEEILVKLNCLTDVRCHGMGERSFIVQQ